MIGLGYDEFRIALSYSTVGNGFPEWLLCTDVPSTVTQFLLCFQKNTLAAGNYILPPSFKLHKSFRHHWQTYFLSLCISDMRHHWRNIYRSWDPRLLHFHSIRGLEEDPAGENAVAVKLYPSLQGQEQRLRNLPLPVFVFIFYLIESVSFSSNQAVQWRSLQRIKEISMHFSALKVTNRWSQGIDFNSLPPEREAEMLYPK